MDQCIAMRCLFSDKQYMIRNLVLHFSSDTYLLMLSVYYELDGRAEQNVLRWFGQLVRMEDDWLVRRIIRLMWEVWGWEEGHQWNDWMVWKKSWMEEECLWSKEGWLSITSHSIPSPLPDIAYLLCRLSLLSPSMVRDGLLMQYLFYFPLSQDLWMHRVCQSKRSWTSYPRSVGRTDRWWLWLHLWMHWQCGGDAVSLGGMSQGLGRKCHHWSCCCWERDFHTTLPVGDWQSVEGLSLWRWVYYS